MELLEPAVTVFGLELWGLEFHVGGKRAQLRVYIDSENGVTVDDCAKVSRQISSVLDVEDPIKSEYVLEVSSPGIDRPLYTLEQYRSYIGSLIKLQLRFPFEGRRNFTGQLTGVEGDEVVIVVDNHEYLFPLASVDKAQVVTPGAVDDRSDN
jgi:ribosome maturation factor RimP